MNLPSHKYLSANIIMIFKASAIISFEFSLVTVFFSKQRLSTHLYEQFLHIITY